MRDEMDGRIWNEHGTRFSEHLGQLIDDIGFAMRRLTEVQFEAPWQRKERAGSNHPGCA